MNRTYQIPGLWLKLSQKYKSKTPYTTQQTQDPIWREKPSLFISLSNFPSISIWKVTVCSTLDKFQWNMISRREMPFFLLLAVCLLAKTWVQSLWLCETAVWIMEVTPFFLCVLARKINTFGVEVIQANVYLDKSSKGEIS